MTASPWLCLEAIPGLIALETDWQRMVGEQFPAFRALCLQSCSRPVHYVRCPRQCGCNHWVIPRHDGTGAIAVCQCATPACPDLELTLGEITPLEVSYSRLSYALCRAFGMQPRYAELPTPNTFQFGSWSSNAVPAILTIQVQSAPFRRSIAEVLAYQRSPFILVAPTSDFLDAPSLGLLQNYGAAFFPLNAHVLLTDHGTLQPTSTPGELFARFNPKPNDLDLQSAQRVFALVSSLDTETILPPPSLMRVFRLYCVEELSTLEVARECQCSKPTIVRRLRLIHQRTGVAPQQLRRLSPHIAKLQDSLQDPRAKKLRPKSGLEQEDEPE